MSLGSLGEGFVAQLRRLATTRKYRLLTVFFVAASVATAFVYKTPSIEGMSLAVVDLDQSHLSRMAALFLEATPEFTLLDPAPRSIEEAESLLTSGQAVGIVVLPRGFAADVKRGARTTAWATLDHSNVVLGKVAHRTFLSAFTTLSAGAELTWMRKTGGANTSLAMPRIQPLVAHETLLFNPTANYALYLAPAFVFFFLQVFVLILAASPFLPGERASSRGALLGRQAAILAIGVAAGLAITYALMPAIGVTAVVHPLLVGLLLLVFCAALIAFVAAFQAWLPSPFFAFQATLMVGMLSQMFAGATYPIDAFPAPLAAFAQALPFTPFVQGLRAVFGSEEAARGLPAALVALLVRALVYLLLVLAGTALRRFVESRRHVEAPDRSLETRVA